MKQLLVIVLVLPSFFYATAQKTKPKVAAKPAVVKAPFKNLIDSFSYAAGYTVANNMKSQHISRLNTAMMQRAIDDVYNGKQPLLTQEQMGACMQKQVGEFNKEASAPEIAKGVAFLDANKKKPGVITLPDGLQYEILKKSGSPVKPKLEDTVVVNYIGSLIDGTEFNNSYKVGEPAVFPVSGVIRAWTEALLLMSPGDKLKIFVPTELAYYLNPPDPRMIPPGAALVFEISLEQIKPFVKQ